MFALSKESYIEIKKMRIVGKRKHQIRMKSHKVLL